jgi:hypothetical protein
MSVVASEIETKWLVRQQKTLDDFPIPEEIKKFLRWVYDTYGFAATDHNGKCCCSVEDRGVFDNEADARWAASCPGGSYKAVPYNVALPEETVMYGTHDFPTLPASASYRNRRLPFTVVPTRELKAEHAAVQRLSETIATFRK